MPYFGVNGESIYDSLREPEFKTVAFSDGRDDVAKNSFAGGGRHIVPLYPQIAELFGTTESFSVLLRPDNYIAMISKDTSTEAVENYFKRYL